jgi:formylglycine-generating enzyme required for sulfatase activity
VPATVQDFRLDAYEVTVGRFRRFVAAYTDPAMIPESAGKDPNTPSDPGWSHGDNDIWMPADRTALVTSISTCSDETWTDNPGGNETKPINCVNWYQAAAFCIWDGARLPTEAEWNYAAAGGAEQRLYPWGNTAPANDSALANYCYQSDPLEDCSGVNRIKPVGSILAGNGRWYQADLAGNVAEWVADWYANEYPACPSACVDLNASSEHRVVRNGSYYDPASFLTTVSRHAAYPYYDYSSLWGMRCARAPK